MVEASISGEKILDGLRVSEDDAINMHEYFQGKIETIPKCWISGLEDFAIWYTPGVTEACRAIIEERDRVFELTLKWNTIAVVSDGTRVLGLGNIGPDAALPVMEGKALLFKYLGGVDAMPLCINLRDEEEIVKVVKAVEPSFGGINLEDIEKPKCFSLLERLKNELSIPVWHDDQQGTATIVCAGLINALKVVGKRLGDVKVAMVGVGAANVSVERLIVKAGVDERKIVMVDSKGILSRSRSDLEKSEPYKWALCLRTNFDGKEGGIAEALDGADVCIAMSRQGPGVIKKEWVKKMNDRAIVFSCANPIPEIWPSEAKEAGAKVVATARSDFPNQLNNSLVFPGIFRGALDVRAKGISDRMCLAAAFEIARMAEEKGLSEEYIVPTMEEWDVYPREAAAAAYEACLEGLARKKTGKEKEYEYAKEIISTARRKFEQLKISGLIRRYKKV